MSLSYGIIAWWSWKCTQTPPPSPTSCPGLGVPLQLRLPSAPPVAFGTSRVGAPTASLFQHLTILIVKGFFLTPILNLPSFTPEPFPYLSDHPQAPHPCRLSSFPEHPFLMLHSSCSEEIFPRAQPKPPQCNLGPGSLVLLLDAWGKRPTLPSLHPPLRQV